MEQGLIYTIGSRLKSRGFALDAYYGPYSNITEAKNAIAAGERIIGRTFGIVENNKITEYWWDKDGTTGNVDPVKKVAEDLYGPYSSLLEAKNATAGQRKQGTTVGVIVGNEIKEYQWMTDNMAVDPVEKIDITLKGAKNGVASLDSTGKVPSSQLPSYVDDVLEFATRSAFPAEGEGGKIYTDLSTNTTWRWAGSAYQQIKGDVVIGTTTGTAFDGAAGAAMQQKVNGIAAGALVNTIETIKINGSTIDPDANKAVNIEVPVVSYATEADIRALFN